MSRTSRNAPRPSPPIPRPTPTLSHIDARGEAGMVDVTAKGVTAREAVARGRIRIAAPALRLVRAGQVKKGDPLQVARLAGIMAAKQTASLIPLCHPLPLSGVEVVLVPRRDGYEIRATVRTTAQTGVEMEALTAVSVTALTLYDMIKAVDKTMTISDIALVSKRGGASGDYVAREGVAREGVARDGVARANGVARSNGRAPSPRRSPSRVRPPSRVRR